MNGWLATREAARDRSEELARFIDDALDQREGNSAHFSDIVTYAVRAAEVTVSCEGEAEEHQ